MHTSNQLNFLCVTGVDGTYACMGVHIGYENNVAMHYTLWMYWIDFVCVFFGDGTLLPTHAYPNPNPRFDTASSLGFVGGPLASAILNAGTGQIVARD